MSKLEYLASQLPETCSLNDGEFSETIHILIDKVTHRWDLEMIFPALDILRMVVLSDYAVANYLEDTSWLLSLFKLVSQPAIKTGQ